MINEQEPNKTFLDEKDIIDYLREDVIELYWDEPSISWNEAHTIPIDFSKFFSYPKSGTYKVELLLKIHKNTSKYRAIFCYFIDLENEDNLFSIPSFWNWNRALMKDPSLSFEDKHYYSPMIDESYSVQHIDLGTHLEITLEDKKGSSYLNWSEIKLL